MNTQLGFTDLPCVIAALASRACGEGSQARGDVPAHFILMRRDSVPGTLSAFFDECGQGNKFQPDAKYYLLTLVPHNQQEAIDAIITG